MTSYLGGFKKLAGIIVTISVEREELEQGFDSRYDTGLGAGSYAQVSHGGSETVQVIERERGQLQSAVWYVVQDLVSIVHISLKRIGRKGFLKKQVLTVTFQQGSMLVDGLMLIDSFHIVRKTD